MHGTTVPRTPTNRSGGGQQTHLRGTADLVLAGSVLFLALTTAAMVVFPGEVSGGVAAHHYRFFDHFFSDLGMTHPYAGQNNLMSRLLFDTAVIVIGITVALFGTTHRTWTQHDKATLAGVSASVAAVLGGAAFVGIAFAPWDEDFEAHTTFVHAAFGLLAISIACLTVVQVRNRAPRKLSSANAVYLLALTAYVFVLLSGPDGRTRGDLHFQVTAQKTIVYVSILNLVVQAWGVRTRATSLTSLSSWPTEQRADERRSAHDVDEAVPPGPAPVVVVVDGVEGHHVVR